MTTKQEKIAELKIQYPTLKSGSDETGYTDFSAADYEATISGWADNELATELEAEKVKADELLKTALLAKLGISEDEAKLLLTPTVEHEAKTI